MKIVMPMAGRGSRLAGLAQSTPKPLVPVAGRPMFEWAMESFTGVDCHLFVAVVLEEHDRMFGIGNRIRANWTQSPLEVVSVPHLRPGQLCSVLAARHLLGDDELLISSSDTLVESNLADDLAAARASHLDGVISVAELPGDKWSFVREAGGKVIEVAEKRRISGLASTGLYWFASGQAFIDHADRLIEAGQRTNDEFYVMPVYSSYLDIGLEVGISRADGVHDMGDLDALAQTEPLLLDAEQRRYL